MPIVYWPGVILLPLNLWFVLRFAYLYGYRRDRMDLFTTLANGLAVILWLALFAGHFFPRGG